MSKQHQRSLKIKALGDSLNVPRATAAASCTTAASAADSQVYWASAPIVFEQMELRCEQIKMPSKHQQQFMLLTAIDCSSKLLFHFEIQRRSSLPTLEAFVQRAEAAFPSRLSSNTAHSGQSRPTA